MADIALMWHGSLQWGVRQVKEWHFLVEMYEASLGPVERHPQVHLTLQFGGQDVEWMSQAHPEFIQRVRRLMDSGQVEVAVGGYSHNFQGATPAINAANLRYAQDVCRRVFGVTSAAYWPAESMLNRGMARSLKDAGFRMTIFDSLNVRHASTMEYAITGKTFLLGGTSGETIAGLPLARFRDCSRRGENAGVQMFAIHPQAYAFDPKIILQRAASVPLVVEVSDWEHFNVRDVPNAADVMMGTANVGSRQNRVDADKIAAWEKILVAMIEGGHRFVTCSEALDRHPPRETLELVDGRDYTKNDLTRLVDATGWHGRPSGGLAGRQDPHRLSDQESYCYSMAGAKALGHLTDLRKHAGRGDGDSELVARTKDVLISFCSAHRSGGEDYTVKQQILDRINRAVEAFGAEAARSLPGDASLFVPVDLPAGQWPVPVNLNRDIAPAVDIVRGTAKAAQGYFEQAANDIACLRRTHRLWIRGPLPAGMYELRPSAVPSPSALTVQETADGLRIVGADGEISFEKWNAGGLSRWQVGGFSPYRQAGAIEAVTTWQDAPLLDEVRGELRWRAIPGGIEVTCDVMLEELAVTRRWRVSDDLRCCQADVRFGQRTFSYLQPFSYRLSAPAFGAGGKIVMIAEGHTDVATEPLMVSDNVHHLGAELIGFMGTGGLTTMAVNRACCSPILRRHPLSGQFILMDSRPIGHSDNAFAYQFAQSPAFEATLRLEPGATVDTFSRWQEVQLHLPLVKGAGAYLAPAQLEWMKQHPHISEVNPYF